MADEDDDNIRFTFYISRDPENPELTVRFRFRDIEMAIAVDGPESLENLKKLWPQVVPILKQGFREHEIYHNTQDLDGEINDLLGDK